MENAMGYEQLLDYRRSVSEMYARTREEDVDPAARSERFRREREELFRLHPQSPLSREALDRFGGPRYFDYDPALRHALPVGHDVEPGVIEVQLQEDGLVSLRRFGKVRFRVDGTEAELSLFWVSGYGGGVLLPFRDRTSGEETYGGGRYVLDTIKHADLGSEEGRLVVDFNFAYNPSCAYDARWHCPLAPPENHLPVEIRAGERAYPAGEGL
jgi:uncharacterized protein (DUF1684 family)